MKLLAINQFRQAVAFAKYPPKGVRGIGAERATCWGQCFVQHAEEADENILVVPIIESVEGGRNTDQMLKVDGVEVFFFGPADYSSSAGYVGQWEGPGVAEEILAVKDAIRAAGKPLGLPYGRFTTGGRLPAHMHDFDESICIIEG